MDLAELNALAAKEQAKYKPIRVHCCTSTGCLASQSGEVKANLAQAINEQGLGDRAEVVGVGCMGLCGRGPLVRIASEQDEPEQLFELVTPDQASSIISTLNGGSSTATVGDPQHPFYSRQLNVVLKNSGHIDPNHIEDYIVAGGYQSLYKALFEMSPEEVVTEITKSGLRGRGGGGFPTGLKWSTVAKMPEGQKYIICNADEGDPGAFMDRAVLDSDPHLVLEGMAIAAYAVGADHGYIYVRAEYPLAIERLNNAIKQAKKYGILGSQIFDSPFDFKIDIRIGAGAFVCGEETALIHSIEGKRGTPRPRPPYPAQDGLWHCPTLINNVETYGNVATIIGKGSDWYRTIGTETSKGTKIFALTGNVRNNGLIEVPMGITLREIIEDLGDGVPNGTIKAVQTGGPSGGCIPSHLLETSVDYDSLVKVGSMMGSGGMVVMDQNTSMVGMAKFYMDFCREESCGKCIPCRAGTVQLHSLLTRIVEHTATAADLDTLDQLCQMVKEMSLCGLGMSAPNPVLSTLRYFRSEYEDLLQPMPT